MSGLLTMFVERRGELLQLVQQHLLLVLVSTLAAVALGVPLGIVIARRPRLAAATLGVVNALQTIPSLALFGFLIPLPLLGGIGARSATIALVLYALLPIVRNTLAGLRQVDAAVLEAATGLGMTEGQRLERVELPLALPVILAGVRTATVISVGTATIAAAIGAGGLGAFIYRGLATVDTRLILLGAIPAALLALAADAVLALVERSPRPARAAAVLLAATLAVILGLSLAARPAASRERAIVIGSKNFTEQVLLGEILAGALEDRGFLVDRRLNLGGTSLCHQALVTGQIDVYAEYTGTALTDVLKQEPRGDPSEVLHVVREGYRGLGLAVLPALGFNNSFALVTTRETSGRLVLTRLSDIAKHAATLRVGLFGEFLERRDGLSGLQRAYGFQLGLAPKEMDLGLLYQALQTGQVDLVVGSATDGLIAARELVVIEDDRRYFPPYDAVVVALESRLRATAGLEPALASLAGRIDAAAMRRMNFAVDGEHRDPRAVAREFLRTLR